MSDDGLLGSYLMFTAAFILLGTAGLLINNPFWTGFLWAAGGMTLQFILTIVDEDEKMKKSNKL